MKTYGLGRVAYECEYKSVSLKLSRLFALSHFFALSCFLGLLPYFELTS